MNRCMRCGGPLRYLDAHEGLCSDNGCFMVFLHTLSTLGLTQEHPTGIAPNNSHDWWVAAYQRIAKQGHVSWEVSP